MSLDNITLRRPALGLLGTLLLLNCAPSVQQCPIKYSIRNGTQRVYTLGGVTTHVRIADYLTDVVGQQFDPPISFKRVPLQDWLNAPTVQDSLALGYDFMCTNSYRSSCYESEGKATTLATERRLFRDPDTGMPLFVNVTQFGAVLYTLRNRTDISDVTDVKGKKIATNKFSNLATHLCYDVLLRNGIHNLQDPEQITYFGNAKQALAAVLDGIVDVGCAAAATLEIYKDPDSGERLDMSRIRILDEQQHTTNDGLPYPFKISSPLVPMPLFQAFPHVEPIVMERVQSELLAMGDHADAAPALLACMEDRGCQTNNTVCANDCFETLSEGTIKRCDTTAELALKAYTSIGSRIFGYSNPQQNVDMRDILEATGFLVKDPSPRCVRLQNIAEAVTCPPGHFARSSEDIIKQCNVSGLECYGEECLCSPCVEAFEVDFIATSDDEHLSQSSIMGTGCPKFSLCGTVEQESSICLRAYDNKKRHNITMKGTFLLSDDTRKEFLMESLNGAYHYEWEVSKTRVGQRVVIIEACEMDGTCKEIQESPFRINVVKHNCSSELFGDGREADEWGVCVCESRMIDIGGKCSSILTIILGTLAVMLLLLMITAKLYLRSMKDESQNDMLWTVKQNELKFSSPPEVAGRGTFGLVLLAEYRGTQVAVKRVIPAKPRATLDRKDKTDPTEIDSLDHKSGDNPGLRTGFNEVKFGTKDFEGGGKDSWEKLRTNFVEEMRILSKLRHPCICTVMGAVIGNKEEPMLVMEYMDYGSLHDLLKNNTVAIDGEIILPILRDISQGIRFLHSADPQVIHGGMFSVTCVASFADFNNHAERLSRECPDLKAANILVDSHFRAKVADFGLSQKKQLRGTGTPYWMAPELLRNESSQTAASDVFSFGVVLIEVYSRKDPYEGENAKVVLKQVADKSIQKRPFVPEKCPSQIQSMITDCLVEKASSRPTFEEIDTRLKRIDTAAADLSVTNDKNTIKRLDSDVGFPRHIAEALQGGQKVEPEHRDCATIVFSDIVDLDNISSQLSADKVADLLDRLHSKFDALADDYGVFPVETIGDTYMAVTNVVKDQRDDHVKRIADFSMAAIAAAKIILVDSDDENKGFVSIRCGFHSGPVVADVVGTKNPRYCLLGDTVNTASLMESKSLPNRIQCSVTSSKLLKQQYPSVKLSSRGMIPIKGKGVIDTYWVGESSSPHKPLVMTKEESDDDVWTADDFSSIETA